MMPSKPRSGLSDTSNNKPPQATPKAVKTGRNGSTKSDSGAPPLQKSRSTPKSVESKPKIERKAPKSRSITPDKQPRTPKGPSELQAQEDLKKAKDQLAASEQEKARAEEELKDAKRLADEANEKLKEALAALKKAEESSEIEKFRAVELEQTSIESSKKKEEAWGKEIDDIKRKHSLDVEALLSKTEELEKVKNELEATTSAKISALSQAEDAMKTAEKNADKVELLSGEVTRLKSLLDSKFDSTNGDTAKIINKLDSENDSLKYELEIAKQSEEKLVIMETLIERLSNEADNAKNAELESLKLVDEWKKKAESLETQLMEARESEKSSLESLDSAKKQLEEWNASLQDSKFETAALRQKVELLEDRLEEANEAEKSSSKQLEELNASLQDAESEAAVLRGKVESLEIEVADVKKAELNSRNFTDEWKKKAELLEVQLAEANKFTESSSDSLASVTKQLEDSNSSLQDVLSENAGLRVKIESLEIELNRHKEKASEMSKEVEDLKSDIQALEKEKVAAADAASFSGERQKLLKELEIAREEEEKAKKAMEGLASALHEMSVEARETQERLFAKRVEHENALAQVEQLRSAIRNTEENYEVMLDEARYEIVCLKKAIEKLETEETQDFNFEKLDNGVEVVKEHGENMVAKEAVEEVKKIDENGELSNSEKEYDLLPNSKEIPMESVNGSVEEKLVNGSIEEKPKSGEDLNEEEIRKGHQYLWEEEPVEVEVKMLEGYKCVDNEKDTENEEEALDEDLDLKNEGGSFDNTNGLPSEINEDGGQRQQQQKKKKHFFKFMLKKKSPQK
ncbi:WEB family protein At3g02930, chloroplastic-like [Asparagus officinalis]|uniref:WEB family protein At3g02930, chloroplastic-like n=1 Tax=Asparagus officinalis TaxID=4686 RepID=UPI00098E46D8|nr:WEB family protein At3g02930, chloroplastic-like [Asparagus officinalis]